MPGLPEWKCRAALTRGHEINTNKKRRLMGKRGVAAMCKIMEDMRNEAALSNARETAERLIKKGKMTLEEIAECVPLLSLEELRKIEMKVMQLAKP